MPKKRINFFQRIIHSRIIVIGGIAVLILILLAIGKEIVRRYEINKEISSLGKQISSLEERNLELSNLIEYFHAASYQEKEARLKLGLQKAEESQVIIPSEELSSPEDQAKGETGSEQIILSNPQKWWNYFFK